MKVHHIETVKIVSFKDIPYKFRRRLPLSAVPGNDRRHNVFFLFRDHYYDIRQFSPFNSEWFLIDTGWRDVAFRWSLLNDREIEVGFYFGD